MKDNSRLFGQPVFLTGFKSNALEILLSSHPVVYIFTDLLSIGST